MYVSVCVYDMITTNQKEGGKKERREEWREESVNYQLCNITKTKTKKKTITTESMKRNNSSWMNGYAWLHKCMRCDEMGKFHDDDDNNDDDDDNNDHGCNDVGVRNKKKLY